MSIRSEIIKRYKDEDLIDLAILECEIYSGFSFPEGADE